MEENPTVLLDGWLLDTAADHQAALTSPAHARLVHVAVAGWQSLRFHLSRRSNPQLVSHSQRGSALSAGIRRAVQQVFPVMVQAGGAGAGARFAANFAQDDTREALAWRPPTGPVTVTTIDNTTVMRCSAIASGARRSLWCEMAG
jgi:hypothetical protein